MKTLDTSNKFKSAGVMNNILMGIAVLTFITGYSCREEELFQTSDGIKEISVLKNAAIIDCENQCIDPDNPVYFESTDSKTITWGNPSNPKTNTVEITCYNTLTHFILKVRSTNGWSDLVIDGISSWVNGPVAPGEWGEYSIELPSGWAACNDYGFSLQVAGNGPPALFDMRYKLIGECRKGTFTDDRDGTKYSWIKIGSQIWMAENLAYLEMVSPPDQGSATDAYCYVFGYYGDDVSTAKLTTYYNKYGVYYNWAAAMNGESSSNSVPSGVKGICPSGWHLPADAEWTVLTDYLISNGYGYEGNGNDIAKAMSSTSGWVNSNVPGAIGNDQGSNNISGFNALPAGNRNSSLGTSGEGMAAFFWTSTGSNPVYPMACYMNSFDVELWRNSLLAVHGFSVRCVKN